MILITTPGFRLFDAFNRQTASQSRANGDGHNCVPNKDRADFPPVLESDHTIAVVQGALRPMSGVPRISRLRTRWREPPAHVAAMAIVAAWKQGVRHRVKLTNIAIGSVERKMEPSPDPKR